jgi:hypothetical protein
MAAALPVRRAGLLLILLASGCAEPPPPQPPPPRQITEAELHPWLRCVVERIEQTDDGRSDASTIAAAARGMCRPQYPLNNTNDGPITIDLVLRVRAKNANRPKPDPHAPWRDCVVAQGEKIGVLGDMPAVFVAANITRPCRHLFQGEVGQDIAFIAKAIEQTREKHGGVFVGPGQKLPPVDKKY